MCGIGFEGIEFQFLVLMLVARPITISCPCRIRKKTTSENQRWMAVNHCGFMRLSSTFEVDPTSNGWKTTYQTNMFLQQPYIFNYIIYIHPRHIIPRWGPASGRLSWQRNSWHQCWRNELIDRELGSKQQIPRGHKIGWCFFFFMMMKS